MPENKFDGKPGAGLLDRCEAFAEEYVSVAAGRKKAYPGQPGYPNGSDEFDDDDLPENLLQDSGGRVGRRD